MGMRNARPPTPGPRSDPADSRTGMAGCLLTGGSGGGGPDKNIWTQPEPQGLLGLNSTVVYGSNVQVAFPINFQMAFGSNLQICISPNAWRSLYGDAAGTAPSATNRLLGSGMGGNMQLTMGTSANFVIGQSFDINLGPRRITLDVHDKEGIHKCVSVLGTIIIGVAAVFLIAYAAIDDDDGRAALLILFQPAMQILLFLLMDIETIYNKMDAAYKSTLDQVFGWDPKAPNADQTFAATFSAESTVGSILEATAVVTALCLPFLMDAIGEGKLSSTPAQPA
jgi:hypothetical protein